MTLITLVGDCTTTTTLALASAFPTERDALVVEADRTGGSVAAWFDSSISPSLSTVVASLGGAGDDAASTWAQINSLSRRSRSGVKFIPTPPRSAEASRAIDEAERVAFPAIARNATALVDAGRWAAAEGVSTTVRLSETIVLCHRQHTASAAAAGVRLERAAELVATLGAGATRLIVAVVGDEPFELREIHEYLSTSASFGLETHQLAVDDLAAAAIAGRRGVSPRRFARLPLIRDCRGLAELITETSRGEV